ncbi:hypothetical protein [Klebsiella phage 05F01]|nr:hypothetical protein [Klebsiella phage 05F01]
MLVAVFLLIGGIAITILAIYFMAMEVKNAKSHNN